MVSSLAEFEERSDNAVPLCGAVLVALLANDEQQARVNVLVLSDTELSGALNDAPLVALLSALRVASLDESPELAHAVYSLARARALELFSLDTPDDASTSAAECALAAMGVYHRFGVCGDGLPVVAAHAESPANDDRATEIPADAVALALRLDALMQDVAVMRDRVAIEWRHGEVSESTKANAEWLLRGEMPPKARVVQAAYDAAQTWDHTAKPRFNGQEIIAPDDASRENLCTTAATLAITQAILGIHGECALEEFINVVHALASPRSPTMVSRWRLFVRLFSALGIQASTLADEERYAESLERETRKWERAGVIRRTARNAGG